MQRTHFSCSDISIDRNYCKEEFETNIYKELICRQKCIQFMIFVDNTFHERLLSFVIKQYFTTKIYVVLILSTYKYHILTHTTDE